VGDSDKVVGKCLLRERKKAKRYREWRDPRRMYLREAAEK